MNNVGKVFIGWVLCSLVSIPPPFIQYSLSDYPTTGPFLNGIEFIVLDEDQERDALYNDETDLIGRYANPDDFGTLAGSLIDLSWTPRNGYGYLSINCDKYPLNITAFRRALAFSLDKEMISDYGWNGQAVTQDSCIPQINPWSCENLVGYDYYQSNSSKGNQILDDAGFEDVNSDGFREAPDGSVFSVNVATYESSEIGQYVGQMAFNALDNLSIRSSIILDGGAYNIMNRLYFHLDYDICLTGRSFSDFNVEWLADEYWSENADEPYYNYPNFRNGSFDSWRRQLTQSIEYNEVYEAAIKMQEILLYECPIIVCYENLYLSAFRTDSFEGFVGSQLDGVANWWTFFGVHHQIESGDPFGGVLRTSILRNIDTFSVLLTSAYPGPMILSLLHDSLLRFAPNGSIVPWLANSYEASYEVATNRTTISFLLNTSAKWSDGSPLTVEDVQYCFNFYRTARELHLGSGLDAVTSISVNSEVLEIEFEGPSYWHIYSLVTLPILPTSYLSELDPERWAYGAEQEWSGMVTSGPYVISEYEVEDHISLTVNPHYFRLLNLTNVGTEDGELPLMIVLVPTIGAGILIAVVLLILKRNTAATRSKS